MKDLIVEEIHQSREAYAKQCGNDLYAICALVHQEQQQENRKIVMVFHGIHPTRNKAHSYMAFVHTRDIYVNLVIQPSTLIVSKFDTIKSLIVSGQHHVDLAATQLAPAHL